MMAALAVLASHSATWCPRRHETQIPMAGSTQKMQFEVTLLGSPKPTLEHPVDAVRAWSLAHLEAEEGECSTMGHPCGA